MQSIYVVFLTFVFAGAAFGASVSFSYGDQSAWPNLPGSFCGGSSQSPIDIPSSLRDGEDIGLTQLDFSYLDQTLTGTWDDNGHTVIFTPDAATTARTVETYRGKYELAQFHFHWGPRDGSEHTVDGKRYSGELHFVHQAYSPSRSATSFDYYTVVGVLLEANDDLSAENTPWEVLSDIPGYNETDMINNADRIQYKDLMPSNFDYYYYNGSLTTPTCNEIVQWVLLKTPIQVPASFFTNARMTEEADGEPLTTNFRDIQPLNGRKVYESASAANVVFPTVAIMVVAVLLGMFSY